jgi:serine/threonine protein phosphatase 1
MNLSKKTFVIGDVHGMYETLQALLSQLPIDAQIVFVGDLIDRGEKSAQVVEMVRAKGYRCVLGNHENTFIRFFQDYFDGMPYDTLIEKWSMWLFANGGKETLQSYDFWENTTPKPTILERIRSDMAWMQQLPIYLELDTIHPSGLPVVVSNSNITQVWHLRHIPDKADHFKDIATRTRDLSYDEKSGIFNIYGHTPTPIRQGDGWSVNVDSGSCYIEKEELGKMTAYCVEEDRFVAL